jgi:RHS repeat-associated protein
VTVPYNTLHPQAYQYGGFGAVTGSSGSQPTEYQFTGQDTDPTGLQYLRARYDEPGTGRFLSRDPAPFLLRQPQRRRFADGAGLSLRRRCGWGNDLTDRRLWDLRVGAICSGRPRL